MKNCQFATFAVAALSLAAPSPATAAERIDVEFSVEITSLTSGGVTTHLSPTLYAMTAHFETPATNIWDAGIRTETRFVLRQPDAIYSDVFSLLPAAALGAVPHQTISGAVSDYPDVFFSSLGFGDQRFYTAPGGYQGQTVSEFFFTSSEAPRSGVGESDGPLTNEKIADLLRVGNRTSFFLFDRIYNPEGARTTWEGSITITSFRATDIGAVPEPSTWATLLLGFGFVAAGLRTARRVAFSPAHADQLRPLGSPIRPLESAKF